jgi:molybdenum cofactor synthesis domain-containing protein
MSGTAAITAAVLVIGDEILSGRTKDKNIGYIAEYLTGMGIDLSEVRVVPDVPEKIISAVNALRAEYTYLFTTGGIGPTHDDITAECVAAAFGVTIDEDERALTLLRERYTEEELTPARRRMARIPAGASLIENPISKAPGFRLGNTLVMAGVPSIMQAMLDNAAPTLEGGVKMLSVSLSTCGLPEGVYAAGLGDLAKAHPGVSMGSYPSFRDGGFHNEIVLRARDAALLEAAREAVSVFLATLRPDGAGI